MFFLQCLLYCPKLSPITPFHTNPVPSAFFREVMISGETDNGFVHQSTNVPFPTPNLVSRTISEPLDLSMLVVLVLAPHRILFDYTSCSLRLGHFLLPSHLRQSELIQRTLFFFRVTFKSS